MSETSRPGHPLPAGTPGPAHLAAKDPVGTTWGGDQDLGEQNISGGAEGGRGGGTRVPRRSRRSSAGSRTCSPCASSTPPRAPPRRSIGTPPSPPPPSAPAPRLFSTALSPPRPPRPPDSGPLPGLPHQSQGIDEAGFGPPTPPKSPNLGQPPPDSNPVPLEGGDAGQFGSATMCFTIIVIGAAW